jgi:hypothetical protein
MALLPEIVLHALLGIALAVLVYAVGGGWVRLARRDAAFAYPAGLLAVVAAAWLFLVTPWLAPISLALLVPLLWSWSRLPTRSLAQSSPFAFGLGVALGVLWHGPTADEDSHAYGDLLFYAAKLVSAQESVLPLRDLLVEDTGSTYLEAGWTFVGAAVGGVDPVLFHAAVAPAFLVAAFALGAGATRIRLAAAMAAALAPLAVAVVAYPTWITESAPVAFALPLAFGIDAVLCRRLPLSELAFGAATLAAAFVLTKGFGLVPLAVAVAIALFAHHRDEIHARTLVRYAVPALVVGVTTVVYFATTSSWLADVLGAKFLPATAVEGIVDQLDRRDTQALAPALLVMGQMLLGIVLARARAWPQVGVLGAATVGNWLVGGHGFDITVAIAVVLALLELARRPEFVASDRALVLGAGAALAASVVCRDISGVRTGAMLALLLGGGVLAALAARHVAVGVAAVSAVGVAALALSISQGTPTLTTEDHDVWREVRERVPPDGLVFTSETGPEITGDQGWNYYPGVAGRAVYVAGWSSSPLLVDDAERAHRLALNRAVLNGRHPRTIPLGRKYGSFYAVVDGDAPRGWRRVYANELYTLYVIP